MKVLVTGAAGHIGANLVRGLLHRGDSVQVLVHRRTAGFDGLNVTPIHGSVSDVSTLLTAMKGVDVVYHLAGAISLSMQDAPLLTRVNVEGTRNVGLACLESGVRRMIHFSTTHALSPEPFDAPITEENQLAEQANRPPYDRSKAAAERALLTLVDEGLDAVIVNPSGVIGGFDFEPSHMGQFLLDLYFRRLPGLVTGGYTWVGVRDVVAGALAAETKGRRGHRYILTSEWLAMPEIAAIAAEITGVKAPRFVSPRWLALCSVPFASAWGWMRGKPSRLSAMAIDTLYSNPDIRYDKAKQELGFEPRPVRDAIAESYAWFEGAGMLKTP